MKQEGYVSTTKLVTDSLWTAVTTLIVAAWFTAYVEREYSLAFMLVGTASTLSSVAVVAHIRCYSLRVASLIRVTAGIQLPTMPSGPSEDTVVTRIH